MKENTGGLRNATITFYDMSHTSYTYDIDVQQAQHVTTHELTDIHSYYSSGTYLLPNKDNYFWVSAIYKTFVDGQETSRRTVYPTMTVPSYTRKDSNNYLRWNKESYGSTEVSQQSQNVNWSFEVSGEFYQSGSTSVTIGANASAITSSVITFLVNGSQQQDFYINHGDATSLTASGYASRRIDWTSGNYSTVTYNDCVLTSNVNWMAITKTSSG